MKEITDDFMKQMMTTTKNYCVVILRIGKNFNSPDQQKITWEHARRNFALREEGLLSIVCPVIDGTDIKGIGIFNADQDQVKKIMDNDPGVEAGIFSYEVHPCRSFPGDSLPR